MFVYLLLSEFSDLTEDTPKPVQNETSMSATSELADTRTVKHLSDQDIFKAVLPIERNAQSDRIVAQLQYKPEVKRILTIMIDDNVESANSRLKSEGCAITNCVFTSLYSQTEADAILTHGHLPPNIIANRRPEQVYPYHPSALPETPVAPPFRYTNFRTEILGLLGSFL